MAEYSASDEWRFAEVSLVCAWRTSRAVAHDNSVADQFAPQTLIPRVFNFDGVADQPTAQERYAGNINSCDCEAAMLITRFWMHVLAGDRTSVGVLSNSR